MSSSPTFECPNCHQELPQGTPACGHCGMRLSGPHAARLWQIHQQVAALQTEAAHLMEVLTTQSGSHRAEVGSPELASGHPVLPVGAVPEVGQWPVASAGASVTVPRAALSGQQVLLGLGAMLLLSACSFFLVVAWMVVGVFGQAAIMVGLTGVSAWGAVVATRRGLPAAAETAAVLASGLLLIDAWAARSLGLWGLDAVPEPHYWAGAAAFIGVLLLACDHAVPRQVRGAPARRLLTYRPVAGALLALAAWFTVAARGPEGVSLAVALVLVAVVNVATAATIWYFEGAQGGHGRVVSGQRAARLGAAAEVVLLASAACAVVGYALVALAVGYDLGRSDADRLIAFSLLLIGPVVLAAFSTQLVSQAWHLVEEHRPGCARAAVFWLVPVAPIPVLGASVGVQILVAVLIAAAMAGLHVWVRIAPAQTAVTRAYLGAFAVTGGVLQAVVVALVVVDGGPIAAGEMTPFVLALPAVAWFASSVTAALMHKSLTWAVVAEVAAVVSVVRLLGDQSAGVVLGVVLAVFGAHAALAIRHAVLHAGRAPEASPAPEREQGSDVRARRRSLWAWDRLEAVLVLFGSGYAAVALRQSLLVGSEPELVFAATCIGVGVVTLAYAAMPGRIWFAYLGSAVISLGAAALSHHAGITVVEAYTAPLAALLAGVGMLQWSRDRTLPTLLTMGPTLSVLFGPSTLVALGDGDEVRMAIVTLLSIAALLTGLLLRWRAPVTVAAGVLAVVAFTQGGPLIAYVPGWVILGAAGVALLCAGVSWESAVKAGRRTGAWYDSLR